MKTDANSSAEATGEQPPTDDSAQCSVLIWCQRTSCAAGATTEEDNETEEGRRSVGGRCFDLRNV